MIGQLLIPGFMALCILLGGSSSGGQLANATLQLIATLVLGYSVACFATTPLSRSAKLLVAIVLCWSFWACLQLIPLPSSLWTLAPGRDVLVQRLAVEGSPLPWLPLSLNPSGTISHLASLLPPLAIGAAILSRPTADSNALRWFIPLLAVVSLLLGVAQLISGNTSPLYFYATSNQGLPVGLMANANHQATLMLCAIPFVASLAGSEKAVGSKGQGRELLFVAMAAMFLMGIAISQSYAAYVLALPVTIASWAIARPRSLGPARYIGTGIAVVTIAALAAAIIIGPTIVADPSMSQSQLSRPAMYKVAANALVHFWPVGSGPGSFVPVFKLFEEPGMVTNVFVNHSHSDYIEFVLEGGIVGALVIVCLGLWWLRRAATIWFARSPSRIDRAAVVATAAILAHSMVDYPARTSAIAAILAAGLALMASRPEVKVEEASAGGRHLKAE
ncbi:MAG: O-antigen ligase family protein [Sphingomonas sp.]|jgi:O-antigen ligase|uniref:O-antigen ligase family protein n=1 Tax=Sphingomonas sp. TaxID=28214 RepID=UPI0035626849